jgi:hypothetical protein
LAFSCQGRYGSGHGWTLSSRTPCPSRPIGRRETSSSRNGRIIAATAENTFLERGDVGFTAIIAGITINGQVPEFAAHTQVWILKYSSVVFTVALIHKVSKSSGIDILKYNYLFVWLFRVSIVHEPCEREQELFESSRMNFEAHVLRSDKEGERVICEDAVRSSPAP